MRGEPTECRRLLALAAVVLGLGWGAAALANEGDNAACLGCHVAMAGSTVAFPDGSDLDIGVDGEAWHASVHGKLSCVDCHRSISGYPHPARSAATARDYQIGLAESCNSCHYAYYTKALDGIHFRLLEEGVTAAPTCVDCHGAHGVVDADRPRIDVDRRCAKCHGEISAIYEQSVHGKALVEEGNEDVPVCTDCHGAHDIADPRDPGFRAAEHRICATCHGDAERMEPYGLSAFVVRSYLDDFHGASNRLYEQGGGTPGKPMATCTDCHGIHDIQPFDGTGDRAEVRARIVSLCSECHEEVSDSFADAWLSHYPPSLTTAPLVWMVRWAYRVLIPFIMLGLVLHILLHLWRLRSTHRREEP